MILKNQRSEFHLFFIGAAVVLLVEKILWIQAHLKIPCAVKVFNSFSSSLS